MTYPYPEKEQEMLLVVNGWHSFRVKGKDGIHWQKSDSEHHYSLRDAFEHLLKEKGIEIRG